MPSKALSKSPYTFFSFETSSANASLAVSSVFNTTKYPSQPHFGTIKPKKLGLWNSLRSKQFSFNFDNINYLH